MLVCVSQYAPQKCLQTHHHVSPPTFGVDILLLLLYRNIYKGIRSLVLVPWMQRQRPVPKTTKIKEVPHPFLLSLAAYPVCKFLFEDFDERLCL